MPKQPDRFDFSVSRDGEEAMIVMYVEEIARARQMPSRALKMLGQMCSELRTKARELLTPDIDVPPYPRYLPLAKGNMHGACTATIGAHRTPDGRIEKILAIYDEGDDTAPVLVLTEEQIEEFIAKT